MTIIRFKDETKQKSGSGLCRKKSLSKRLRGEEQQQLKEIILIGATKKN
jgi:hypothetical protein